MSNTTDPELILTNMCKPPKNFEFPETALPFSFLCFEECPWVCILVVRIKPIAWLVIYLVIKMWENLFIKPYQTWKIIVKMFKKHQKVPTLFIDF